MTVAELIADLSKLPQDAPVLHVGETFGGWSIGHAEVRRANPDEAGVRTAWHLDDDGETQVVLLI